MDDPGLLQAYDEYYRHVSCAQVLRVLDLSGLKSRTVLDMGAGPGSVSLALAERGAESFHLVDSSSLALERARASLSEVSRSAGKPLAVTTKVSDLESPDAAPEGSFDLIAFGHCLNEIGAGDDRIGRRLAIIERAAARLAPDGAVMVMEPATLAASRDALALRDRLAASGWQVVAPCTFRGPCPALAAGANHTCHDEAAWDVPAGVRRLADSAGLDRDLIKMTWFIVVPPSSRRFETTIAPPTAGIEPRVEPCVEPGVESGGESDRPAGAGGAYRVVSVPMLNKGGRVRYLICGPAGRFPFSARKDDERARLAGFFNLGRYDLLRIDDPEIREGGWGFGPSTRIVRLGVDAGGCGGGDRKATVAPTGAPGLESADD